ncbi:hypothetical protein BTS2_0359 [Bacillus sp. TS-2]|nr:hypothetical protein BTS2_0359 [Bacillus sp. TS-2]
MVSALTFSNKKVVKGNSIKGVKNQKTPKPVNPVTVMIDSNIKQFKKNNRLANSHFLKSIVI